MTNIATVQTKFVRRNCVICKNETRADLEVSIKSGRNSNYSFAFCNSHYNQLLEELYNSNPSEEE